MMEEKDLQAFLDSLAEVRPPVILRLLLNEAECAFLLAHDPDFVPLGQERPLVEDQVATWHGWPVVLTENIT